MRPRRRFVPMYRTNVTAVCCQNVLQFVDGGRTTGTTKRQREEEQLGGRLQLMQPLNLWLMHQSYLKKFKNEAYRCYVGNGMNVV